MLTNLHLDLLAQKSALMIYPRALQGQRIWSEDTFGPGFRTGVFRHLEKEIKEAEAKPDDISEWADLLILTLDGAMRAGHSPIEIIHAYYDKQIENLHREWPDWREFPTDQPIEHVR